MTIGRGAGRLVLDISEADDPAEVGEEALDLGGRARDGLPVEEAVLAGLQPVHRTQVALFSLDLSADHESDRA